jgi:peroxiredoxin
MNKLLLLFFSVSNLYCQEDEVLKLGQTLPSFSLITVDNDTINSNELKGKIIFINFFSTWCSPCLEEFPVLKTEIFDTYKNYKDFLFLAIGRGHSSSELTEFKKRTNNQLPLYPDKEKIIYSKFANVSIPRNYIINRDGIVIYVSKGFYIEDFHVMTKTLNELLIKEK